MYGPWQHLGRGRYEFEDTEENGRGLIFTVDTERGGLEYQKMHRGGGLIILGRVRTIPLPFEFVPDSQSPGGHVNRLVHVAVKSVPA